MSGSATFTIVTSSRSMKTPVQTATSVHHLRSIGEPPGEEGACCPHATLQPTDRQVVDDLNVHDQTDEYAPAPMRPLSEHTGYLLRVAHDRAHMAAATEMPGGPHPRLFGLLTALLEVGPLSQQQLAAKMRVNRTLVVGIVDDLERRGWVERRRAPGDRRSYGLHVTEAGRQARDAMVPHIKQGNERMTERLSADERAQLNARLRAYI